MNDQSHDLPVQKRTCMGTIIHCGGDSTYVRGLTPSEVLRQIDAEVDSDPDPTRRGVIHPSQQFRFIHGADQDVHPNGIVVNISKITMLTANWA